MRILTPDGRIATLMGDDLVVANVTSAYALGQAAILRQFWNESGGFFRAVNTGNQVFTDTLYDILHSQPLLCCACNLVPTTD